MHSPSDSSEVGFAQVIMVSQLLSNSKGQTRGPSDSTAGALLNFRDPVAGGYVGKRVTFEDFMY